MAEEMTVLPGMDEIGNLLWITDHVESGQYDVSSSTPPRPARPSACCPCRTRRWWIERIAPIGRRVSRLGRPMLERVLGMPIPRDEVFAAADRLLDRLSEVHHLLSDPDRTSVRIKLALDPVDHGDRVLAAVGDVHAAAVRRDDHVPRLRAGHDLRPSCPARRSAWRGTSRALARVIRITVTEPDAALATYA